MLGSEGFFSDDELWRDEEEEWEAVEVESALSSESLQSTAGKEEQGEQREAGGEVRAALPAAASVLSGSGPVGGVLGDSVAAGAAGRVSEGSEEGDEERGQMEGVGSWVSEEDEGTSAAGQAEALAGSVAAAAAAAGAVAAAGAGAAAAGSAAAARAAGAAGGAASEVVGTSSEGNADSSAAAVAGGGGPRTLRLDQWQVKKLVKALQQGRRHVNVKALAAELHMDRRDVLSWLRRPPPDALKLAQASPPPQSGSGTPYPLEGKTSQQQLLGSDSAISMPQQKWLDTGAARGTAGAVGGYEEGLGKAAAASAADVALSGEQRERWQKGGKRIGQEHLATLEAVFQRSQYPTGTMIASLVSLTNLPRRRILQWFEERRLSTTPRQSVPRVNAKWKASK